MARALMSSKNRKPCPRRVKRRGAAVIEALALVAVVVVVPGALPSFLPGTVPMRSWQAPAQESHRMARSRKALELPRHGAGGRSRVALLAAYKSMKVVELKALCREKDLRVTGTKAVLISRLEEADGPEEKVKAKAPKAVDKAPKATEEAPKAMEKAPAKVKDAAPKATEKAPAKAKDAAPKATEKAPAKAKDADGPENVDDSEEDSMVRSGGKILPGDRVNARYHHDNRMYPGVVLDQQDEVTYLISWDEPDENEPLSSCTDVKFVKKGKKRLEPGEKQLYYVGDKVSGRFDADNGWYEAELLEFTDDTAKIKWKDPDGSPPITEVKINEIKLVQRVKSACE